MSASKAVFEHLTMASQAINAIIAGKVEKRTQDAIIAVNAEILEAQKQARALSEENTTLLNSVSQLEAKIVEFGDWAAEKARYEQRKMDSGVVVYALKESEQGAEPEHELCANCFEAGKRRILAPEPESKWVSEFAVSYRRHCCKSCGAEYYYGAMPRRPPPKVNRHRDYDPYG